MQLRKRTPSKTPDAPPGGAPPVTPASGTGVKRKKKTSSRKKSSRKVAKRLDRSFDKDDVSCEDEEPGVPGTGPPVVHHRAAAVSVSLSLTLHRH